MFLNLGYAGVIKGNFKSIFMDKVMNVVISTHGSGGDIVPFVGIAHKLKLAGANVTFLVNEVFREMLEFYDFNVIDISSKSQYLTFNGDSRIWSGNYDSTKIGFENILKPQIEASYEYIAQLEDKKNTLVIGIEPFFNGALLAAKKFSMKSVYIYLWPKAIPSLLSPPAPISWGVPNLAPKNFIAGYAMSIRQREAKYIQSQDYFWELNGFRRHNGLQVIKDLCTNQLFEDDNLQIGLFPSWFGMPSQDWPINLNMVGFPDFKKTHKKNDLRSLDKFLLKNPKPIVFTSGTAVFDTENIFTVGRSVCESLGIPGVFVGGDKEFAKEFVSDLCIYIEYADFDQLFPEASLIVHHGGIGTLSQAIRAGVPQLIRPLSFDQPDNAQRIKKLGLGDYILPKKFKVKRVIKIIKKIFKSQTIKEKTIFFSHVTKKNSAIEYTCDLIEDYFYDKEKGYCSLFERAVNNNSVKIEKDYLEFIYKDERKEYRKHHEILAIKYFMNYYQVKTKINDLSTALDKDFSLKKIILTLDHFSIKTRALICEAHQLIELSLPCLIQWQHVRFVVLIGFNQREAIIYDSLNEVQKIPLHVLSWCFSNVVVEVEN